MFGKTFKSIVFEILVVTTISCIVCDSVCAKKTKREYKLLDQVEQSLDFSEQQLARMVDTIGDHNKFASHTRGDGTWITVNSRGWVSGFFPGCMWYIYEYTQDDKWKENAAAWTEGLKEQQYYTGNHDLGFMMYCSYGAGYRLTGNEDYKKVVLQSAASLMKRYNPEIGCTRSWGNISDRDDFVVIIDNMVNLELLLWASKNGGSKDSYAAAVSHSLQTEKALIRDDYSTYHVVHFDPVTNVITQKRQRQGYALESCWSRGQAWAIYGYTVVYRETGDKRFLEIAKKLSDYYIKRLPDDWVPYWDFDAGEILPNQKRDSSAATIAASGLLELSTLVKDAKSKEKYFNAAENILSSLCAPPYLAKGTKSHAIVLQSARQKYDARKPEIISHIWGDYYFVEALMRYRNLGLYGCIQQKTMEKKEHKLYVKPIDFSAFNEKPQFSKNYLDCRKAFMNCVKYNLSWTSKAFEFDPVGQNYILTEMNESGIRAAASVVYGLAIALKTQQYDEDLIGVSRENALTETIRLARGIAAVHKVNRDDGQKGWGDSWQSGLWAALLGFGGQMIWDDLDYATQQMLVKVVQHEANRFIDYELSYWNNKDGNTLAEENAWNSMILNVAVTMMPKHPNMRKWKLKSSELMVSSYCTEDDWKNNNTVLDGRAVKDWLNGYNALPGGVVINHDIIHPGYMVAQNMNMWGFLTQSLAGKPVPQTAQFNGALIYKTFVAKNWTHPPYEEPGGTIFIPGQAQVYYPNGNDWSDYNVAHYYLTDVWAHLLGWDSDLSEKAIDWMRLRTEMMLRMQFRHSDRHMYADSETNSNDIEQYMAWQIGDAFLALWLDAHGAMGKESNWLRD